jgi:hypothetical protein
MSSQMVQAVLPTFIEGKSRAGINGGVMTTQDTENSIRWIDKPSDAVGRNQYRSFEAFDSDGQSHRARSTFLFRRETPSRMFIDLKQHVGPWIYRHRSF